MKLLKIFLLLLLCYNVQARTAENTNIVTKNNLTIQNQGGVDDLDFKETCRVHRQGKFWLTVSNYGKYGNVGKSDNLVDPETGKRAPMGLYPGSIDETYQSVYMGALWIGGYVENIDETTSLSTFAGPYVSLGADGWDGSERNFFPTDFGNVEDEGSYNQKKKIIESSTLHSINYEGTDVFDPKASAEEQYTVWYTDKVTDPNTVVGYKKEPFVSLGIEVKQVSYSWSYEYAEDFVLMDFTIYNSNEEKKDIVNMFIGMYQDSDCGLSSNSDGISADDISGFKGKYDFVDKATGLIESRDINCAWSADNDGREFTGAEATMKEPESGPLDGARGITAVRVVRTPNPHLKLSFNWWNSNGDESFDYGPRWIPGDGSANAAHSDWAYDLTKEQEGYYDYKSVSSSDTKGPTEGTPQGPIGRYQVMSNGEFDYNQTMVNSTSKEPQKILDANGNVTSTKSWEDIYNSGISDANIDDIANGYDTRFFLSFGPLGNEGSTTFKGKNSNGELVDITKPVWRLTYGDSIKLTLALIMGDNFHQSDKQNPKKLNVNLFNFTDLANNAIWASKVYDNPLYDTPVTIDGVTKRDGWYGEDVGVDGLFAAKSGDQCWWANDAIYIQSDTGENNGKLDDLTVVNGDETSEDNIARYGNTSLITEGTDLEPGIGLSTIYGWQNPNGNVGGNYERYGYADGVLEAGDGLPDFKGPPSPPSPDLKVVYDGNDVIIKWASDNWAHTLTGELKESAFNGAPENIVDPFSKLKDFEGYQFWLSPSSTVSDASKLISVDNKNYAFEDINQPGRYYPETVLNGRQIFPMLESVKTELTSLDSNVIYGLGTIFKIVPLGDNIEFTGSYSSIPGDFDNSNWEYTTEVINNDEDSFRIYSMRIKNKLKGRSFYAAVTSSDFGDPSSSTAPLSSNPANNLTLITPTTIANQNDPVVFPNPYRTDLDYLEMGWEKVGAKGWSEQQRKIAFINIPKLSIVRIYTVAGDLVRTLTHNGSEEQNLGDYGTYWNLLNGNNQTVASGLYVYSVQDANDKDDVFIGKLTIIR